MPPGNVRWQGPVEEYGNIDPQISAEDVRPGTFQTLVGPLPLRTRPNHPTAHFCIVDDDNYRPQETWLTMMEATQHRARVSHAGIDGPLASSIAGRIVLPGSPSYREPEREPRVEVWDEDVEMEDDEEEPYLDVEVYREAFSWPLMTEEIRRAQAIEEEVRTFEQRNTAWRLPPPRPAPVLSHITMFNGLDIPNRPASIPGHTSCYQFMNQEGIWAHTYLSYQEFEHFTQVGWEIVEDWDNYMDMDDTSELQPRALPAANPQPQNPVTGNPPAAAPMAQPLLPAPIDQPELPQIGPRASPGAIPQQVNPVGGNSPAAAPAQQAPPVPARPKGRQANRGRGSRRQPAGRGNPFSAAVDAPPMPIVQDAVQNPAPAAPAVFVPERKRGTGRYGGRGGYEDYPPGQLPPVAEVDAMPKFGRGGKVEDPGYAHDPNLGRGKRRQSALGRGIPSAAPAAVPAAAPAAVPADAPAVAPSLPIEQNEVQDPAPAVPGPFNPERKRGSGNYGGRGGYEDYPPGQLPPLGELDKMPKFGRGGRIEDAGFTEDPMLGRGKRKRILSKKEQEREEEEETKRRKMHKQNQHKRGGAKK